MLHYQPPASGGFYAKCSRCQEKSLVHAVVGDLNRWLVAAGWGGMSPLHLCPNCLHLPLPERTPGNACSQHGS